MLAATLLAAAAAALAPLASAQSVNEPEKGKLYLGAWLDTADSASGAGDGDRPTLAIKRMGYNLHAFHYAQNIPVDTYPFPIEQIEATGLDALVFLTVYPRPTPWTVTDADINELATMCGKINNQGHRIVLRFGPEMNGPWNYYGQAPLKFIALWKRVFAALRRLAPATALVWAPSSGSGYPFGTPTAATLGQDEFNALDTNKDGAITAADDAYTPYYPGDDFVDWVGLSAYYYGPQYPWEDNVIPPAGTFEKLINVNGFYQNFAVAKNKPMLIAETAAAFHTNTPKGNGDGEFAVKQAFWRQYLTNATFLDQYERIKLISLFEFKKYEEKLSNGQDDLRDFRITNNSQILTAFMQDFAAVKSRYIEAVPLTPSATLAPPVPTRTGKDSSPTGTAGKNGASAATGSWAMGIVGAAAALLSLLA
ncbi:hypothetical protein HK105_203599 [Polyrhizophydium stewartii]|uniref:GH26 domain-containing protein n=1 Tax=Polyrhizophydium stewartii TaxID=2732419 RepID=A0ABR4NBB0_9FUNG